MQNKTSPFQIPVNHIKFGIVRAPCVVQKKIWIKPFLDSASAFPEVMEHPLSPKQNLFCTQIQLWEWAAGAGFGLFSLILVPISVPSPNLLLGRKTKTNPKAPELPVSKSVFSNSPWHPPLQIFPAFPCLNQVLLRVQNYWSSIQNLNQDLLQMFLDGLVTSPGETQLHTRAELPLLPARLNEVLTASRTA